MAIKIIDTNLPEVKVLQPNVFEDKRGFFYESYNERDFYIALDKKIKFVQDNHSKSLKGVLRGLHYQVQKPQAKLVRVVNGSIFDVAVDIRKDSPNFGSWFGTTLSAKNHKQLWVPTGFAHGFLVISEEAEVIYKTTDFYYPEFERTIKWNDEDISINWPNENLSINLSEKDNAGLKLKDSELPYINIK